MRVGMTQPFVLFCVFVPFSSSVEILRTVAFPKCVMTVVQGCATKLRFACE